MTSILKFHPLLRTAFFFLLFLCFTTKALSTQLVEVDLDDPDDLKRLLSQGLDVVQLPMNRKAEVLLHSPYERGRLNETGLCYYVVQEDIESYLTGRLGPRRDAMGDYYTFDEIVAKMDSLHDAYPDIVSEKDSLGHSIEDRTIWLFKVSDNPGIDEDEPEVLYTSLIHAREVITPKVLFGYVDYLTVNYEDDAAIRNLVDSREMWFIPCHNPDGYVYNEQTNPDGGGMWRKNRRDNGDGSFGVDLNRNFGYEWGYDDIGSSPYPSSVLYRGTNAFSEPETQIIREFVNNRHFNISLYLHSYSNLCIYPPGYDYLYPVDRSVLNALGSNMTTVSDYVYGTGWEIIYMVNGSSDDWLYMSDEHDRVLAFTIEIGGSADWFWPPAERIAPLVAENIETCRIAAEYADLPERILRPPSPDGSYVVEDPNGHPIIQWNVPDDASNPPVNSRVTARIYGDPVTDDAPVDQTRWDLFSFSMSSDEYHSATHSYATEVQARITTMTLKEKIAAPDTIWTWMNYDLESASGHYIALEVSYDGYYWEPLPGLDSEDLVRNGHNLGPGITGQSNGWLHIWFTSGAHTGEMVRFRFRLYWFSGRYPWEVCYIDDIYPLPGIELDEVVAEEIENPIWVDTDHYTDEGLEYQVQTVDNEADSSFRTPPLDVTGIGRILPRDTYAMIGISVEVSNGAANVLFGDDFHSQPPGNPRWRLSRWDDANCRYLRYGEVESDGGEYGDPADFAPGLGFWLVHDLSDTCVLDIMDTQSVGEVAQDDYFPVSLFTAKNDTDVAWTQVANPFNYHYDWRTTLFWDGSEEKTVVDAAASGWIDGYAYSWDGAQYVPLNFTVGADPPFTLDKWAGCFLAQTDHERDIDVRFTPEGLQMAPPQFSSAGDSSHNWSLRLSVTTVEGGYRDEYNIAGIDRLSEDGYDFLDALELTPMGARYVHLYFTHPDLTIQPTKFTYDYRSTDFNGPKTWSFVIHCWNLPDRDAILSWYDIDKIDDGYRFILKDDDNDVVVADMRVVDSYTFRSGGSVDGESHFKLVAVKTGSEYYVEDFGLMTAYPNPFNQRLSISFNLPVAQEIRLSIFDLQGRVVADLGHGSHTAGLQRMTWNAEGSGSGLYFIRLETPGEVVVRKVVLVR